MKGRSVNGWRRRKQTLLKWLTKRDRKFFKVIKNGKEENKRNNGKEKMFT